MTTARQDALPALDVELDTACSREDVFVGHTQRSSLPRLYGGLVAAQALTAAGLTVDAERLPHSVHANFLRSGTATQSVRYEVNRMRDSRSFSTRAVTGFQNGQAVLHLSADFHLPEPGATHQKAGPVVPGADSLDASLPDALAERFEREWPDWQIRLTGCDSRDPARPGHTQAWLRLREAAPDSPGKQAAALLYASDMTLLSSVALAQDLPAVSHGKVLASLDHAMWFHREIHVDEWLLYDQESPTLADGRGLAIGSFYDQHGRLVATVVQQGLLRAR